VSSVPDRLPRRGNARSWVPLAVLVAVGLAILVPSVLVDNGSDRLAPIVLPSSPGTPPRIPVAMTMPRGASPAVKALILYDRTGHWGWLGEQYATMTANLVGHFGRWTAKPVARYRAGDIDKHTATIYIGSTYNEPLPRAFLDDVLAARRPVLWAGDNIGKLRRRAGDFAARYGWTPHLIDRSQFHEVRYKGVSLTRWSRKTGGIRDSTVVDPSRARVLAEAVRDDGRQIPWGIRSGVLTYVAEVPYAYMSETDRTLAFDDLLFDLLAPHTRERHRALLRLEDIDALSNPNQLRAAADYLHSQRIPFGFGVIPRYRDPTGHENGGDPKDVLLRDAPQVVGALRYMIRRGGVLIDHGYTHQFDGGSNPYNGVTGDDVEFYRVTEGGNGQLVYGGPLPHDSFQRTGSRLAYALREFQAAGLPRPRIFEFPHYFASRASYRAAARWFAVGWERSLYFPGQFSGRAPARARPASQFFPYAVRDVYGRKVLPENLGSIAPERWRGNKARLPADILDAARAQLVVRDNVAGFFFHPFLDLGLLRESIEGLQRLGYTFVSPNSL
jgi:uncharacterized protein YdaL